MNGNNLAGKKITIYSDTSLPVVVTKVNMFLGMHDYIYDIRFDVTQFGTGGTARYTVMIIYGEE